VNCTTCIADFWSGFSIGMVEIIDEREQQD